MRTAIFRLMLLAIAAMPAFSATITSTSECEVGLIAVSGNITLSDTTVSGATSCRNEVNLSQGRGIAAADVSGSFSLEGTQGNFELRGSLRDVEAIGLDPVYGYIYSNVTSQFSASTGTSIYTAGPSRQGFAYLQNFGTINTVDGSFGGSVTFNGSTYVSRLNNSTLEPRLIPISLGGPISISAMIGGHCGQAGIGGAGGCAGDYVDAAVHFQIFEADGISPVSFSETPFAGPAQSATPEPTTRLLLLMPLAALAFRRKLSR